MSLVNSMCVQLQYEGIAEIIDLQEWEEEDWDNWYSKCRNPTRIPDPDNVAQLIYENPFAINITSLKRLKLWRRIIYYWQGIRSGLLSRKYGKQE